MNKTVLAVLLMSISVQASACCWDEFDFNDESPTDTRQLSGLGIGAVIGGLIAGPPGIFGGASIAGAFESWQDMQERSGQLAIAYQTLLKKNRQYEAQLADYKTRQNDKREMIKAHYLAAVNTQAIQLFNNMELTALFRVANDQLEPLYRQQLTGVLESFSKLPDCHAYIEGHADRTGSEKDNLDLSERRIASIKDIMLKHGWNAKRIHTRAMGETKPLARKNDKQGYMFDRRVLIHLSFGGKPL